MPRGVYDRSKAKPRRERVKPEDQPVLTVFPTLNMRQAHVLLECIRLGMAADLSVNGQMVQPSEWEGLIRQLVRK